MKIRGWVGKKIWGGGAVGAPPKLKGTFFFLHIESLQCRSPTPGSQIASPSKPARGFHGSQWVDGTCMGRTSLFKSHLSPTQANMGCGWAQADYHGLACSETEWVFGCKTHANPMKNPQWVLSGHNGLAYLKPKRAPLGLAIWAYITTL